MKSQDTTEKDLFEGFPYDLTVDGLFPLAYRIIINAGIEVFNACGLEKTSPYTNESIYMTLTHAALHTMTTKYDERPFNFLESKG